MRYSKFLFLIGLVLFLFILWNIGIERIFLSVSKANPVFFIAGLFLVVPNVFLKGIKQSLLLKVFGKKISLLESTQIWLVGYLLGSVSPGRSGDFLRAVYFKKNFGTKLGNGLSLVLVDRALDVGFLMFAALAGLFLFSMFFKLEQTVLFAIALLFVLFLFALFMLTKKGIVKFFLKPIFNFLVPEKFKNALKSGFGDFYSGLGAYKKNKATIFFAAILTVVSWFLFFFQVFLFSLSLGLPLQAEFVFWIMPIVTLVEILPISFSGIGTRDAAMISFTGFAGIAVESAVSLSIMILFSQALLALFGVFFLKKIKS